MNRKKILALLLCGVLLLTMLPSCGGGANGGGGGGGGIADDTVEDGKVNGLWNVEGLPIAEPGTLSFSIFVDDSSETGEWAMLTQFMEDTGIDVNVDHFPYEVAVEKKGLALTSGDLADVMGGWLLSESDILKYGINQKIFVPLDEYFEAYCPQIEEILDLPGVREAMTTPDGHIYSFPYVLGAPKVDFKMFINQKWLANLNLDMPTTTDEFHEVLKAFKEKDANGNGDPNDEIPLSFDPNNRHINYIPGWFGVSCDNIGMTMKDGELAFGANTDEFKKGIEYLAMLNSEGLIDSEAFTQDISQWKAKGNADLIGASMAYGGGDIKESGELPRDDMTPEEIKAWLTYAILPVLKGSDNPVWFQSSEGNSVMRSQAVVTNKAQNVGAICRFFDYSFQPENGISTVVGPEGIGWEKRGDEYWALDKSVLSEEEQNKYSWQNLWLQSLPHFDGFIHLQREEPEYDENGAVDEMYAPYFTGVVPAYWIPLDQIDTMAEIEVGLKGYIEQKTAEWISGQADINAEWDSYVSYLDTLGLDQYMQMRKDTAAGAQSNAE